MTIESIQQVEDETAACIEVTLANSFSFRIRMRRDPGGGFEPFWRQRAKVVINIDGDTYFLPDDATRLNNDMRGKSIVGRTDHPQFGFVLDDASVLRPELHFEGPGFDHVGTEFAFDPPEIVHQLGA